MGIDYGRGITNIDKETGIRYGIIHQNLLNGDAMGGFVQPECEPTCPICEFVLDNDGHEHCPNCGFVCDDWYQHSDIYDGPLVYTDKDYELQLDSSGDVWVFKSPWTVLAGYASPCAPGAVDLTSKSEDALGYALGPDWFDGEPPYTLVPFEKKPAVPKTITAKELKRLAFCNSKELTKVVLNGHVYSWEGIGFVDEGPATAADKEKYPTVVE